MGENIHKKIAEQLRFRIAGIHNPAVKHRLERELKYELSSAHKPSQGVWVLTDFGIAIDPVVDIRQDPTLARRPGYSEEYRKKLERRGAELINTKVPHILRSLRYERMGGATTGELLEDTYFTTSSELYSTLARLRGEGRKKTRVTVKNRTAGFFRWLLGWPSLETIVKLVKYQPSPDLFQFFASQYETLGMAVRAATRFGFTVDHQARDTSTNLYVIPLPEELAGGQLEYDPLRTSHVARFQWGRYQDLSASLQAGGKSLSVDPAALEQRIETYGQKWFEQRLARAAVHRQSVGLR